MCEEIISQLEDKKMKKNIKNDKVLRAITIALATMITVTASPVTVLADENAEPDNDTNTSESEESGEETSASEEQSQSEETSTVAEASEACENAEAIIEGASEESAPEISLTETIEDASAAVAEVESVYVAPAETIEQIQAELTEAAASVESTEADVDTAQTYIEAASDAQSTADTITAAAAASVETVNSGIETINEADSKAEESVVNAESFATEANTAATKEEAEAAAENASAELASVEAGLEAANSAYETASAAASQAEVEYVAAEAAHAKAVAELEKANEAIKNAQGNATAAQERMKAAQAKVDALEKKVNTIAENKEALENLSKQYYNFLVHYYRNDAKTDVYKADGTLDLEKSAAKAVAEGKAVDPGFCPNTLLLGRDLLKELVSLKLKMNGADADSIVFATEGKDAKQAAAGTLTKDNKGNARVVINAATEYTQYWDNQTGDSGRNNHAKVTYTKDGVEYTEYYNYVAKASKYEDKLDLENGTIFLASVTKGDDGKWHAAADNSEFSFDNYAKLLEAINIAAAASEDMNEYNKAKEAVDAATAEVDRLKNQLDKINKVSVDGSVIRQLKAALEQAQADLEEAKDTRDALAGKVAQAKAIVESIDLSRFEGNEETVEIAKEVIEATAVANVEAAVKTAAVETAAVETTAVKTAAAETTTVETTTVETAAVETTAVETAAVETTAVETTAVETTSVETETVATAADSAETADEAEATGENQATSGVLGARVEDTAEESADEAVYSEVSIKIDTDEAIEEDENAQAKLNGIKKLVKIEDNETPLADMPFESDDNISWWWLLVIALLGATGKAMYENHKRKEEANK